MREQVLFGVSFAVDMFFESTHPQPHETTAVSEMCDRSTASVFFWILGMMDLWTAVVQMVCVLMSCDSD